MRELRKTVEFQTDEEVFRVDCLGNLVDDLRDRIIIAHTDIPAFYNWLSRETAAVKAFGLRTDAEHE